MRRSFVSVHDALVARGRRNIRWRGMGATLTALWLHPAGAIFGHVGDSRLYMRHGRRWRPLTEDHNVGAGMIRRGEISEDVVARMKFRSLLEQVMGGDGAPISPQVARVDIVPGDMLAMCSDGLHGPLEEPLEQLLERGAKGDLAGAVRHLVDAANAAGGPDNISVVLTRVVAA
jgi:protein phosphatase